MNYRTFGAYMPMMFRDAEGGGSGGGNETDTTNDDGKTGDDAVAKMIAEAVSKAVGEATAGLKKKNEELIGAQKKLKDELTAAKSKHTLTDEELASYTTLQEKLQRDEMLRDIAEGKTEEVIERITKRTRVEADAKFAAEAEARTKSETEAQAWRSRYEQTLINVEVTKATAALVKPQYQDLILKIVSDKIKLVDGAVRIVNEDGDIETTSNGSKPLAVSDYIESLRTTYGDLFVTSAGGGAGGSSRKGPGTSNKLATEVAADLPIEEYIRLRKEGRI